MNTTSLPDTRTVPGVTTRESEILALGRDFARLVFGHVSYMICQGVMFVLLARLCSVVAVGQFALALAMTTPIVLFSNLGLRRVLATDATSRFHFSEYLGLRLLSGVAALMAITLLASLGGFPGPELRVIVAMGVAKLVESVIDIVHGYFQKQRRLDFIATSIHLRGPLSLVALAIGLLLGGTAFWGIVAMGTGWLLVLALYDWPRLILLVQTDQDETPGAARPKFVSGRHWMELSKLAAPLGFVALLGSLRASIPNLAIEHALGVGMLGIFTVLAYFHAASNRVVTQLGEAAIPRLARYFALGEGQTFTRTLVWMLTASLAVSALGIGIAVVAGEQLLEFLYGPLYAGYSDILILLMAVVVVANLQTLLEIALTAARQFRVQPFLYGASALLLLALCIALVPNYGLRGAVASLGLVATAESFVSAWIVARALNTRMQRQPSAVLEVP